MHPALFCSTFSVFHKHGLLASTQPNTVSKMHMAENQIAYYSLTPILGTRPPNFQVSEAKAPKKYSYCKLRSRKSAFTQSIYQLRDSTSGI